MIFYLTWEKNFYNFAKNKSYTIHIHKTHIIMKKPLILMAILCLILTTNCKKKEDTKTKLEYLGENPIEMALLDELTLNVSSEYPVTVKSLNDKYITVIDGLKIKGKNVGSGEIELDNGHETLRIPVNVRLFKEPSFNFGCSKADIRAKHGNPDYIFGDSVYIYGNYNQTSMFVSYACTQMNFLFSQSGNYAESHVFIIDDVNTLLEKYLTEDFIPYDTLEPAADSIYYFYKNRADNRIICGRYNEVNKGLEPPYKDTWLFYFEATDGKGDNFIIPSRPSLPCCQ